MAQMKLKNMYINRGVNNGSEKLLTKNTATSGKLIIAVYAVHVFPVQTSWSGRLECNSLFVGLGGWGVKGDKRKIWQQLIRWMTTRMGSTFRVLCRWEVEVRPGCLPMTQRHLDWIT
jgi:hypothetical protein